MAWWSEEHRKLYAAYAQTHGKQPDPVGAYQALKAFERRLVDEEGVSVDAIIAASQGYWR
jgi:recombinational DNA repair protein (RecF pathway)